MTCWHAPRQLPAWPLACEPPYFFSSPFLLNQPTDCPVGAAAHRSGEAPAAAGHRCRRCRPIRNSQRRRNTLPLSHLRFLPPLFVPPPSSLFSACPDWACGRLTAACTLARNNTRPQCSSPSCAPPGCSKHRICIFRTVPLPPCSHVPLLPPSAIHVLAWRCIRCPPCLRPTPPCCPTSPHTMVHTTPDLSAGPVSPLLLAPALPPSCLECLHLPPVSFSPATPPTRTPSLHRPGTACTAVPPLSCPAHCRPDPSPGSG